WDATIRIFSRGRAGECEARLSGSNRTEEAERKLCRMEWQKASSSIAWSTLAMGVRSTAKAGLARAGCPADKVFGALLMLAGGSGPQMSKPASQAPSEIPHNPTEGDPWRASQLAKA